MKYQKTNGMWRTIDKKGHIKEHKSLAQAMAYTLAERHNVSEGSNPRKGINGDLTYGDGSEYAPEDRTIASEPTFKSQAMDTSAKDANGRITDYGKTKMPNTSYVQGANKQRRGMY